MNKDEKTIIDVAADTEKADPQQSNSTPETVTGTISAPEEELQTLTEVIKEQATEDESPLSANFTLRKILGGDILNTSTIRHQIWLFLLIAFILLIYISNRYSCQQDLIEIDKLKRELQDARYKALSTSSQITEKSRESNVLNMLKDNKDSVMHIANQPPFIINVPEE